MQVTQKISENSATLVLAGRFDFNAHRDFRDGYETVLKSPNVRTLDIDLTNVDYLDSSALGMLLLLKERAGTRNISLSLVGCQGTVKQILEIANFNKLFSLR